MRSELFAEYFNDKSATVMGLGLLGRGVGDTAFLAEHEAKITVTDMKSEAELSTSVTALSSYGDIIFHLGGHKMEDFENRDFILKAAGVPLENIFIKHAIEKNIPVYMSAALTAKIVKEKLKDVTVIGITGTRGKSTVTHLIHYILTGAGKRAHLGGNVRGVANLPLLEAIEEGDYLVLELDSWQLQGFGDLKLSPDIAVFTSFLDDHLNYYKNDKELYFADKAKIFINQDSSCLIASTQAADEIRKRIPEQKIEVPEVGKYDAMIIGHHNDIAISLALSVAEKVRIAASDALALAKEFKAVPGRLERLGIFKDVIVYNDNNATTPDAVIAGIKAINDAHNLKPILIMGGSDKNLDLTSLEKTIKESTSACVLLSGTGTDKLTLSKENMFETLSECTQRAFELAKKGDVILFSPGFASFSKYFNNEYERGDEFVKIIHTIQ
jgi:UDP-N-acetylmuramoylalanine--D-glutamate ligase